MADFADRSLGIGYAGGSALLLACLAAVLGAWYASERTISVDTVSSRASRLLLGGHHLLPDPRHRARRLARRHNGLGYEGGALVFGAALAVVVALYYGTRVSRVGLFWAAFILTRPLGAMVGDFLDKPVADGGLNLSGRWRPASSRPLIVCSSCYCPSARAGIPTPRP